MRDLGLLGDILILVGVFCLGFAAGIAFPYVRRLIRGAGRAPGRLWRGTREAGRKVRQALGTRSLEPVPDRDSFADRLSGTVADVLTFTLRHAHNAFREGLGAFDQGDVKRARARLSEALFWDRRAELRSMHVLAHIHLGQLDMDAGDLQAARGHFWRAAELDPGSLPALMGLGQVYYGLQEVSRAILQFQRALELDPTNLDTRYWLYAVLRRANMEGEALDQLRTLKAGERAQDLAALFARHGEEHFRRGGYADALDDHVLAVELDPQCLALYRRLGDLYQVSGQPFSAVETWCRGLWQGYSGLLADRVLDSLEATEDMRGIVRLVRQCAVRHDADGRYRYLLSRVLRAAGDTDKGRVALEQAVQLSPGLLDAQLELGDLSADAGQEVKAGRAYRAGLCAALAEEKVFQCGDCGYRASDMEERCPSCGCWHCFSEVARGEQWTTRRPTIGQRLWGVRHRLHTAWIRIAGQLPSPAEELPHDSGLVDAR